MSDTPKSDGDIWRDMQAALAKWRSDFPGAGQREPFDADRYYEQLKAPEPQHQWQNHQRRAYAKLTGAGLEPGRCRGADWATMVEVLARAMSWDMPHGWLLCGVPGNGKSTLLRLIKLHGYAGRGEFGWRYREAPAMRDELVSAGGASIEEPSWSARCLLIDDMGTEKPANIYGVKTEAMHEIIDARWNWHERGGRTIIATNLRFDEIQPRYGDRALSRLKGMCRIVKLETPDQRRVSA